MPADYRSTARALALSPSPRGSPRESPSLPPWSTASPTSELPPPHQRRRLDNPLRAGRLSASAATGGYGYGSGGAPSFPRRVYASVALLGEQATKVFLRLTPLQRVGAVLAGLAIGVLGVLAFVYSHSLFAWLGPIAERWRALPGGWILVFLLVFATSFPPLIGYSTAATISGFVYDFPNGWPVVAAGCTIGAVCAFVASRTILSGYVDRIVGRDHRFVALGQVLRQEGLLYLTAIRFCPLPFSLSNGFLATIPTITPLAFAISTALSSPKLLIHVFIGSRLARLAKGGDQMSAGSKAINYLGMALGGFVGVAVALVIYRRTMARAAELARRDEPDAALANAAAAEDGDAGYADDSPLMDPEDAAVLMSEDDISLWARDEDEVYRDEQSDEAEDNHDDETGHAKPRNEGDA